MELFFLKKSLKLGGRFCTALTCIAGVPSGRANITSWQSFIRPAMFDLELDYTVGVGVREGREHSVIFHSPIPTPLLTFDRRPPPLVQISFLASLPLPLKSKMAAMIFVKKILSTRSPKLRLLCRFVPHWHHNSSHLAPTGRKN